MITSFLKHLLAEHFVKKNGRIGKIIKEYRKYKKDIEPKEHKARLESFKRKVKMEKIRTGIEKSRNKRLKQ